MKNDIGNYAMHAKYWDWGNLEYDRTAEDAYWYQYAKRYGNRVLIPMCALGEAGAYMARRGIEVTAFDITPEMIAEGRKRFADVEGLHLREGDVRCFRFDIPPTDFCYAVDFGHIHTIEQIKQALLCIRSHLRDGGGLVIETGLRIPGEKSDYTPVKTFLPQNQMYPNLKIWKTGDTHNDAATGQCHIAQTVYVEDENGHVERFDHSFTLQSYYRGEWVAAFDECGFEIVREYRNREAEPWRSGDKFWGVEAKKTARTALDPETARK